MEINRALEQIEEIHGHLAKADMYRGYKALPVAMSGVVALAAAAIQSHLNPENPEWAHWIYWMAVALLAAAVAGGGIIYSYVMQDSPQARRHTRIVVGQLLPPLGVGAIVYLFGQKMLPFLPGICAIFFSLGMFASRPYLPKMIGWVALYYLCAGMAELYITAPSDVAFSPWAFGLIFGIGQLFAGLILYWNLERNHGKG